VPIPRRRVSGPIKHCDILLSLGTGNKFYFLARQLIEKMIDANAAWQKFINSSSLAQQTNIFRLSPTYEGIGYDLDDFGKLDDIESETERWMATQDKALTNICNKLIASLFFFRLTANCKGEILCRLPVEAYQDLVKGMREEAHSNPVIFMVEYDEERDVPIDVAKVLSGPASSTGLCFHVTLPKPPRKKVLVTMRTLGVQEEQWLPISGSPYVIPEDKW
jgi:hypothetical protein